MNSSDTPKLHPDENRLTAFAEQALGDEERGEVLRHLADCERCRGIVFLAKEAETALARESAFPTPVPTSRPRRWRTAVLVAACVVVVAAAISTLQYVRRERIKPQFEAKAGTRASAAADAVPDAAARAVQPQDKRGTAGTVQSRSLGSHDLPQKLEQHALAHGNTTPAREDQSGIDPAAEIPRTAAEYAPPVQGGGMSVHGQAAGIAAAPAPMEEIAPVSGQVLVQSNASQIQAPSVRTESTARRHERNSLEAGPLALRAVALPETRYSLHDGAIERWDGSTVKALPLAGGVKATAIASRGATLLALDSTGLLHRSGDAGESWTIVNTQWRGHATGVQALTGSLVAARFRSTDMAAFSRVNKRSAIAAEGSPAQTVSGGQRNVVQRTNPNDSGDAVATPVYFELVNDTSERWVSTDLGNTWQIVAPPKSH